MPRIARIILEQIPYHITQRGNARQQLFFDAQDYRLYLDLLWDRSKAAGLGILAYCLMPNHVHLIAVPERGDSMAAALGRTHASFARYFNLRQRACGHVWQSRYFSCPLDDAHLWAAMAYVERNPVRAGMVERAELFRWSTAGLRLGARPGDGRVELARWAAQYSREQWRQALASGVSGGGFRAQASGGEPSRAAARRGGFRAGVGGPRGSAIAATAGGTPAEESDRRESDGARNRCLSVLSRVTPATPFTAQSQTLFHPFSSTSVFHPPPPEQPQPNL
jgi:putative transposase